MEKSWEKRYVAKYYLSLSMSNFMTTVLPGHPLFGGLKSLSSHQYILNEQ